MSLEGLLPTFAPMHLHTIQTGFFKLDGGAMFGVVPKQLWEAHVPPDDLNLCTWSMRLLLIESSDRLVLIDTGIGDKQSPKFFSHYHLHGGFTLDGELAKRGFHRDDITDVLLTHLHFDHVGGAVRRDSAGALVPAFQNATFWSCERHWQWAVTPNAREKASFLAENILPLEASGRLRFVERTGRWAHQALGLPELDIFFADGHTESQMIPVLQHGSHRIAFMADLLPSAAHVPLAWVMGYDTRPLLTLEEKDLFLHQAASEGWVLFLEHDGQHAACTVNVGEKGVRVGERAPTLEELLG